MQGGEVGEGFEEDDFELVGEDFEGCCWLSGCSHCSCLRM